MGVLNGLQDALGIGKLKTITVETSDGEYRVTAKENILGKITVTFDSKKPKFGTPDADQIMFDDSRAAIAWKRLPQPIVVSAGLRPVCISRNTVDVDASTQTLDIQDSFERLKEAAVKDGWGERERLQLDVIALRAKYPRANRPLSSHFDSRSLESMVQHGVVRVTKQTDGTITINALSTTGEGFVEQNFDKYRGLQAEHGHPINPDSFAVALNESIDHLLEQMFSSRKWAPHDIKDFLDTCFSFNKAFDQTRLIVEMKPNSVVPTPALQR